MTRANIDDLINGITPTEVETEAEPTEKEAVSESEGAHSEEKGAIEEPEKEGEDSGASELHDTVDANTDEYGNEVQAPRMYSEEDVQRMIRDRLSRGQNAHTPQQNAQVQEAAQNFKADPNSSDEWEVQLEGFIKKTLDKVNNETQSKAFQQKEQQKQAEFESKFTTSMDKYKDFRETVGKVPITDSMMMATRDMKDPAAFIYAASKNHAEDLKRISTLGDPFQQAAEIGRLEERMKKARSITRAAAPLSQTKSDVSAKVTPKYSIDSLIQKHAKSKVK